METAQLVLSIIVVIAAVIIIAIVLLQSGKNSGLSSSLGGSFDTYMGKNKASSADARLARLTKWVALVFMLAVLVLNLV
ncbi:MAG: preprotein translocase subunit SecG [Clostridiales bacterium]|nr:preprotein translocase subunit SecG [Clostridiales bacterium]